MNDLHGTFEDYNEMAPQKGLHMLSPRILLRANLKQLSVVFDGATPGYSILVDCLLKIPILRCPKSCSSGATALIRV